MKSGRTGQGALTDVAAEIVSLCAARVRLEVETGKAEARASRIEASRDSAVDGVLRATHAAERADRVEDDRTPAVNGAASRGPPIPRAV